MPARTVLLVLLVPLLLTGGGTAAHAATTAEELAAWALPVPDAQQTLDQSLTPDQVSGCAGGHERLWTIADGTIDVLSAFCADSGQAAAALRELAWNNAFVPNAAAAPAFDPGTEVIAVPPGGGTVRYWIQGAFGLMVIARCAAGDGCGAQSAEWARSIAALPPDPPSAFPSGGARAPGDLFGQWQPRGEGWSLVSSEPPAGLVRGECSEGTLEHWVSAAGAKLEAWWTRCDTVEHAFAFQASSWPGRSSPLALETVFGAGHDKTVAGTDAMTGRPAFHRSWVQGTTFVSLYLSCPTAQEECDSESASDAVALSRSLPGIVQEDMSGIVLLARGGWLLLGGPILLFVLLVAPFRIVHWWRSRGYSVAPAERPFTAVDRIVRPVRIGRVVRRLLVTVAAVVSWYLIMVAIGPSTELWVAIPGFLGFFVLIPLYDVLLRLVWRRHALIDLGRARMRPTPLGIAGAALRTLAVVVAALALVLYGISALQVMQDEARLRVDVEADIARGLAVTDPLALLLGELHWLADRLDHAGAAILLFVVVLLVPMTAAYLLDRLGQRLGRRSLKSVLAKDDRPYFVYLRGFDEDRLRIRESAGRQGFLELFTPFGRPRFEEVLVHYLSRYGPVIAISPRRQRIPDLGAAKISLSDESWQDQIRAWVGGARAVVMSATPGEVRAGLEWELEHVAMRGEELRLLLVLAPWPRQELARRWGGFLERAGRIPLFEPLTEPPFPDGLELLTWSAERGWHGYGARRRWDWTYAASIVAAARNGDLGEGIASRSGAAVQPAPADTVSP
ncbi:hypothetical protein [Naasia aerilata]|uniref:DUF2868 domain-containing protein n=1 Tax=Naasia aerilata TaxID=1162966 RepID=A0ABM8GFE9_9MICO|nr:hypothetical protein [Naasia aerilata]BDZ47086.1 hypothetical protein GCM10025866_29950 [Naasia aerilata]